MSATAPRTRKSIAELEPGQRLDDEIYRIAQKDLRTTTNGGLYIHVVLADGTGQMLGRVWNATQEMFDAIPDGGFLHVRGRCENYKGAKQFIIDGMRAVAPENVDPAMFLPKTRQDVEQMWARTKEILRTIRNPDLLALIGRFVNDADFTRDFKLAPAAMANHHAHLGGLLEHTLNLLELALLILPRYPLVSRDLVLAGIFLHDAGKTRELGYDTNFVYTNEGQLIGHITTAALWVREKVLEIERESGKPFPREVEQALQHIILAHHGQYEFGSPRLPAMAEAFVVHYLDNLDAKLSMVFDAIATDPDNSSDWTKFVRTLNTKIFKLDVMGEQPDT